VLTDAAPAPAPAPVDEAVAVRRLYDRLGFGRPTGQTGPGPGFAAARDALLDPSAPARDAGARATPPPELAAPPPRPTKKKGADPDTIKRYNQQLRNQQNTLVLWWLDRMAATDAPATERMTWFWHGHFATGAQKVHSPAQMLEQNQSQRRLAMAGFADLAQTMIVDPAMLHWLDGNSNRVGAPNENLAREFMELFALGVGHYGEPDVREAARALTGWVVRPADTVARLVPRRHDNTSKTILGSTADFDAPGFVNLVLSRPESAPFLVGRLWSRLVSAVAPPPDAQRRLLDAYGAGRDVRALVRAMVAEPAFRDPSSALVKQPVEWLVGLLRALRVRPGQLDPKHAQALLGGLRGMGQVPFAPPSVGGWPANGAWLTTSAGLARLRLAQAVTARGALAPVTAASPTTRADAAGELLGVDAWTPRTRNALARLADDPPALVAMAACAPEYVVSA
jgi:uncharacterized protein (DUF1800 family)